MYLFFFFSKSKRNNTCKKRIYLLKSIYSEEILYFIGKFFCFAIAIIKPKCSTSFKNYFRKLFWAARCVQETVGLLVGSRCTTLVESISETLETITILSIFKVSQ